MEARHAVEAVAVDQGDRGIFQRRRALGQRLGQRGAPEEGEGRGGVEFDIQEWQKTIDRLAIDDIQIARFRLNMRNYSLFVRLMVAAWRMGDQDGRYGVGRGEPLVVPRAACDVLSAVPRAVPRAVHACGARAARPLQRAASAAGVVDDQPACLAR